MPIRQFVDRHQGIHNRYLHEIHEASKQVDSPGGVNATANENQRLLGVVELIEDFLQDP